MCYTEVIQTEEIAAMNSQQQLEYEEAIQDLIAHRKDVQELIYELSQACDLE